MKINRVNIGEIILNKVKEQKLSDAEFARRIGIQRQNVKKTVFEKHSLDTDLLCVISEVLDCNFFDYFYSCNKNDYKREVEAKLTIEVGEKSQDKQFRFVFGENDIEIK